MRVHEYIESILLRFPQHIDRVLYPRLVVLAGSSRLNRLPCEYISNGVIAVALQSRKVDMSIFFSKGSAVKFDVVSVEEILGDMGGDVWRTGEFRVPGDVYTAKEDMPAIVVPELAIFDSQSKSRHNRAERMFCRGIEFVWRPG